MISGSGAPRQEAQRRLAEATCHVDRCPTLRLARLTLRICPERGTDRGSGLGQGANREGCGPVSVLPRTCCRPEPLSKRRVTKESVVERVLRSRVGASHGWRTSGPVRVWHASMSTVFSRQRSTSRPGARAIGRLCGAVPGPARRRTPSGLSSLERPVARQRPLTRSSFFADQGRGSIVVHDRLIVSAHGAARSSGEGVTL